MKYLFRRWHHPKTRTTSLFTNGLKIPIQCLLLAALCSSHLAAEATCERTADQVGLDRGYPVRAALAAVPHGQVTGREVVRYFIRLDSDCLLSRGMHRVDALAVRLNHEAMETGGSCLPTSVDRQARVLFGVVPSSEPFDTRTLEARENPLPKAPVWTVPIPMIEREIRAHRDWYWDIRTQRWKPFGTIHVEVDKSPHVEGRDPFKDRTTKQRGGWARLPLGKSLEVRQGYDVVLGLEVTQEPWECPLLMSGPFEASESAGGSYLQLVRYEYQTADGGTEWKALDCTGTREDDDSEGLAFAVEDLEARARCDLRFPHTTFQWNLRAAGPAPSEIAAR